MNEQNNNDINSQQQVQANENSQPTVTAEIKPKKKRSGLFTLFACIMTAIIVVLAMNIGQQLSKGVEKKSSNSSNTISNSNSNNDNSNTNETTKCDTNLTTINFDNTKSINNSNEKSYILASQGPGGIYATTDTTQKVLKLSYTPANVSKYYSLNWGETAATTLKTEEIKFEKKISELFFGGFGQSSTGDTLFILLEDGTVEYIPLVHMFNNVQAQAVSYGAIKDVSNIVKFVISEKNGEVTTLAIKSDGTFYDLSLILKSTGNYK